MDEGLMRTCKFGINNRQRRGYRIGFNLPLAKNCQLETGREESITIKDQKWPRLFGEIQLPFSVLHNEDWII